MESKYQRFVNLSYLALAALVGFVAFKLGTRLSGTYDLETRVRQIDLVLRGISLVLVASVFVVLNRSAKANLFMNEVMAELARVSWPTQKETTSATGVVIVMVLISGMLLGLLDYFWTVALKWVL